ncbi:hypothetical protein DFJ74DRAFT_672656 [Hyaloraphidium curvatum]|nr:hypothetical protein DFJ74DRAFT_698076 [Hyaloraphidium curvatum]KAI9021350.1 hypothetical protein DFJ74DRAFT_672656 [Hyaloraphidium curvatum]
MRTLPCLLIAALAVAAPLITASPTPGAVFKRSCTDCDSKSFCEFAYPGTPEGQVACVSETVSRSAGLYRRYAPVWEECGTGDNVCSADGLVYAGTKNSAALCQAACDANVQCTGFVWSGNTLDCMLQSAIRSHVNTTGNMHTWSKAGCGIQKYDCI